MPEIKRLGVLSVAKMQGLIGAVMGVFVGLLFALFGAMSMAVAPAMGGLGFAMIIIAPILYGCIGFVLGAVLALIYNMLAGWVGGIEIEFAQ